MEEYINYIRQYGLLDEETERQYAESGDTTSLVLHNLRLAFSIAATFQNRGVALEDLVQEANMGLIKAAEKFDINKGYRFSTYAAWWVRQALSRVITNQGRTIRIPAHVIETNSKIEKIISELRARLSRMPTDAEIGEQIGKTAKEVREIREYFVEPISIDTTFGEDDENTIGSVIEDTNTESPIEFCISEENSEIVDMVLATIPEKEAKIIRLRIQQNLSLEEVGKIMGLTAERVRQLEMKGLRKLRHPYRAEVLRSIML